MTVLRGKGQIGQREREREREIEGGGEKEETAPSRELIFSDEVIAGVADRPRRALNPFECTCTRA